LLPNIFACLKTQQSKPWRRRSSGGREHRWRNTSKSARARSAIGCSVVFCPSPRPGTSSGSN
jgi:hypothetical protein